MIVELPFFYEALAVPARARKPIKIANLAFEPFEIQEISAAEAPLVATLRLDMLRSDLRGHETVVEYRRSPAGHLMRPLRRDMTWGSAYHLISGDVTSETVVEDMADFRHSIEKSKWTRECPSALIAVAHQKCWVEGGLQAKRWISDDRDARLAEMRGSLGNAAFVDGKLFVPSLGPGFRVIKRMGFPTEQQATALHLYHVETVVELGGRFENSRDAQLWQACGFESLADIGDPMTMGREAIVNARAKARPREEIDDQVYMSFKFELPSSRVVEPDDRMPAP